MAGLIMLGVATITAGMLSGRVVLEQALETYAVQAANDWTRELESRTQGAATRKEADVPGGTLQTGPAAPGLRGSDGVPHDPDMATGPNREAERGAGRSIDFALLDPQRAALARSTRFSKRELDGIQASAEFGPKFDQAVIMRQAKLLNIAGEGQPDHGFYVLVPIIEKGRVDRVYVVRLDQSASFRMTKDALTRASLVTTLLMVLGFVVPAAVASRRIREGRMAEEKLRFLAMHDPLTRLANRNQLQERLSLAVARARRRGDHMAVFYLDLDRFKDVNDTLGHPAGDALLEEVAMRIKGAVREVDLVARLGGDEFAIVAEEFATPDNAAVLAERLCDVLAETYHINGHEVVTSASIGIAFGPLDAVAPDAMLSRADIALYRAKQNGRNGFCFFKSDMDAALQEERRLQKDLGSALGQGELRLHYQPQIDVRTGNVTGYEALARWQHPVAGEIAPGVFVPLAEQSGLIGNLSEWVMRTACDYASEWPEGTMLAVNLSPAHFKSQNVAAFVARLLGETGFPADRLELEITERVLLSDTDSVIAELNQIAALGVSVAMDDFGTGYSKLGFLNRVPINKIKIDRSFIAELGADPEKNAVVSSIIALGQSLNVTIAAEGVETARQLEFLKAHGCDEVQGYFCGRPRPKIIQKPFVVVDNGDAQAAIS